MKSLKSIFISALCAVVCFLTACKSSSTTPSLTQVADYLWEVTINDYCDTIPNFLESRVDADFNCSAVRNGNYYGRNLDYFISEVAEFVIHTPAKEGRHATLSVGRLIPKSDADIKKGITAEEYSILPWDIFDGINDAGLFCNTNVTSWEDGGDNPGTNPGKPRLCNMFIPRALLDNCASVEEAINYINNHDCYGRKMGEFNLHFMIGDPERTVVLEFIDNKAVFVESNIMTNFPLSKPRYTAHADGIERYNILQEHYAEGGESMASMQNLLKRVRFSQAYDPNVKPFWNSEYENANGFSYMPETPLDTILANSDVMREIRYFEQFKQTGKYEPEWKLWWTLHNSTYDIRNRKLWLIIREKYEKYYEFSLN